MPARRKHKAEAHVTSDERAPRVSADVCAEANEWVRDGHKLSLAERSAERRRMFEEALHLPPGTLWGEMVSQAYREHAEWQMRQARLTREAEARRQELEAIVGAKAK